MLFSSYSDAVNRAGGYLARINIDDQFWRDILKVSMKIGNHDVAVGQAVRFIDIAQLRYKSGRIITESEFEREGFHLALEGVFAERVEGGWMAVGADKNFSWLRVKVENGRKGGVKSGESRRNEINNLGRSKTKQTKRTEANEANSSDLNPLPLPLKGSKDPFLETVPDSSVTPPVTAPDSVERLASLWNEHVSSLPKVKSTVGKRRSLILRALKENPDLGYWAVIFQKVERSDFLSGRNGRWTACGFDWILGNDKNGTRNHVRVDEGVHDNRQGTATPRAAAAPAFDWTVEAQIILEACRRFGSSNPLEAEGFLGQARWAMVRSVGGMYRIGQLPRNDFTPKTLAGMLKAAAEMNNAPSERTAKNASLESQDKEFHVDRRRGDFSGSDQSGGREQQPGQVDDLESLRVRGEGIFGFLADKDR